MRRNSVVQSPWRAALLALVLALLPAGAAAQQAGSITGSVMDDQGAPVAGARVSVVGARVGAVTDAAGRFTLEGAPAGAQQLRVEHAAHQAAQTSVRVEAGQAARVEIRLQPRTVELDALVVSASRRPERVTEAPAAITRINANVIDSSSGSSYAALLKQVPGLDFVQVGMTSVGINARGFNSSFNNRMLMVEDGRVAVLPENGLPVGQFTAIPKIDLAGVEVLVGPGAALYGADASSGVLSLQTKDPRQFQGTTVEASAGNRAYRDIQARHAGVAGRIGYKIAGQWQRANDWQNSVPYKTAKGTVGDQAFLDWTSAAKRVEGALVYYGDAGRFEFSAGRSENDGVGQTNIGRNQLTDWGYNFAQAKFSNANWYANLYRTQSTSGKSYAVNRFIPARFSPATAGKSDEEVRLMSDWPADGRIYAAELQNNFLVAPLLNTRFTWGAQYRRDLVSSDREWLLDRKTGEDLEIGQYGVYGQSESELTPWLRVVLAARYDNHEMYDAQFSPKAGVVLKPAEGQALRVTFNRAFKSPTTLQTSFYIPNFITLVPGKLGLGVYGNTEGFTTSTGTFIKPLVPEENLTWEIGYKGLLASRLLVDVTGYHTRFENFFSPLMGIGGSGVATRNGKLITDDSGVAQYIFTYFNLGRAELQGVDAGLSFLLTPKVSLNGTVSAADLKSVQGIDFKLANGKPDEAKNREMSTLNSPTTKWTVGVRADDVAGFNASALLRHVNSYNFASGINVGRIPTFTTADLGVGYRVPLAGRPLLSVSVANLFTCRTVDPNDPKDTDECGFGKRHAEMINMPSIGTMLFVGLRYHVD